ncbi:NADH-quinone oxidoreductase subunit I [Hominifimenecus sp. rT4P-3]|uniref:NADH-quinone oxidoreductase subunit I n=1 Tax=Hominifimenecus sp. rT4P-3 TaxID=3242979 RepID=UPI003DA4F8CB
MLIQDGIPTAEDISQVMPSVNRLFSGPVAIAECFQKIPCNPCVKACPKKAIHVEPDINETPKIDFDSCVGCGICISHCPGLAIFVVDMTYGEDTALLQLPYEFLPLPEAGQFVLCLDRSGQEVGTYPVVKVTMGGKKNKTYVVSLAVPKKLAMEIRNIRPGGDQNE